MKFIEFPELPKYVSDIYKGITEHSTCGGPQTNLLFGLSLACGEKGAVTEIGSFVGRSTIALAAAQKQKNGNKIFAIDPLLHSNFYANIKKAGLKDWVDFINDYSYNVAKHWEKPIELLFIDGNHSYFGVKEDISAWSSFVVEGGYIVLHDYATPYYKGIDKAVYKTLLVKPNTWRVVSDRDTGSIIVFQRLARKEPKRSFIERVKDASQLNDIIEFFRGKILPRRKPHGK